MILWKKTIVSGIICFMLGCSVKPSANVSYFSVTAPEFKAAIEKNAPEQVLLDVRTPEEFAGGHIKGALNIDFYAPDFQARLSGLDKTKTYLIYCRSGNRTSQTTQIMRTLGFNKVTALKGGILDWNADNFPLEK